MIGIRLRLLPAQRSEGHAILSALLERPTYLISFFTTPSFLNVKVVLVWSFRRICDETLEYFKIGNRFETHWLTFKVQSQVINPFTFDLWKPQKRIILNVKSYWIKKSPCFTSRFTAWKKLFGKITQSFGDISVGIKGVVIFFSTSIISCLEKHAIKNPMLYTSLSSHLSLLEKLGLDDDIIFNTSLGTTFPRKKKLPRIPS